MKKCKTFKVGTGKRLSLNLNPVVTILSACLIWALVTFCMIVPETANAQVSGDDPFRVSDLGPRHVLYDCTGDC